MAFHLRVSHIQSLVLFPVPPNLPRTLLSFTPFSVVSHFLVCSLKVNRVPCPTGYGHVHPLSEGGKIFCIIYAVIGIPMTFILLTALVERLLIPTTWLLYWLNSKLGHLYQVCAKWRDISKEECSNTGSDMFAIRV